MNQIEHAVSFHEHAPTSGRIGFSKQFVGQNQKKQIRTAVADETLEFRSAVEPILERGRFAQNAPITAVSDRVEIVRIVFGEKRITGSESGIVNAKMFFENLTPARE